MQKEIKRHILLLLEEIEAYRSHSLYAEAKNRCIELLDFIQKSNQLKDKHKLLATVSKKIKALDNDIIAFEQAGALVRMSDEEQEVVKKLFSFPMEEGTGSAIFEGAAALLVFGQYEGAFKEFNKLMQNDDLRVVAGKNLLRCHMGFSSIDDAIKQYQIWLSEGKFPDEQLDEVRLFLQGVLDKKGIDKQLPVPIDVKKDLISEEEFIDILSVILPLDVQLQKKKEILLDVNFQRKNMINLIVSKKNQDLIEYLKIGKKLNDVQFNSTDIIFKESCIVSEKSPIRFGPKIGDYTVTLEILNM
jgi:tetratricopeptide (TPR) repeat protein